MIRQHLSRLEKQAGAMTPSCPLCGGWPVVVCCCGRVMPGPPITEDGRCRHCGQEARRYTVVLPAGPSVSD